MQEVEDIAYATYEKNIEYISKNHPKLSNLLTYFDMALQNGEYEPLYDLEYINNNFDIKVLNTSQYLYNSNSIEVSSDFTKTINLKKENHTFEGFPIYIFNDTELRSLRAYHQSIAGILPFMRYYAENFMNNNLEFKEIDKFMFIGTGLGLHIPLIDKKLNAKEYLIVEDSVEIFKLSLFTTKYYELAQNANLYFSIADDETIFLETMKSFLSQSFYSNRYLKYAHFPIHSDEKLKLIQTSLLNQSFVFFPYQNELEKFINPLNFINNGYKTLMLSQHLNTPQTEDKPALVLGAGPSFKKNIDWIKKNKNKFIIIAVSAILPTLEEHNITPNIVTHIDGSIESLNNIKNVNIEIFLKDTLIILGSYVSSDLRNMFNKENIYNIEEDTNYYSKKSLIAASCVGSFSILFTLLLNFKNSYLLGVDLAVNQKTGATHHDEKHSGYTTADMDSKDSVNKVMNHTDNLFEARGNFTDNVYTNSLLHTSVQLLFLTMQTTKSKNQHVYNMSEGAYINKTIPKNISEINTNDLQDLNKKEIMNSMKNIMGSYSATELSKEDIESFNNRLAHAKKIHQYIQDYSNLPLKSNSDSYQYDLLGLVSDMLQNRNRESVNLIRVFFDFFQFALPMITDALNTKKLKNEKRHIKKFNKYLLDEMLRVSSTYINALENFKKER